MTTQLLIYYSITLAGVVRNALQARVKAWPLAVLLLFIPQLHGQRVPNRYIVELSTEPVADHVTRMHARGGVRGAEADAQRTRVRGEQQSLRARIEQQQAKILDSTNTVANTLFVEVSDKDVAKLKSLPGVKRVTQVRLMHPLLDRAVVLQHVQDAWNRVGADKAGAGAKIAIVDTGIESTHPAFQDSSLSVPDSFPRVNDNSDLAYTNSKIIVARSYVSLLPNNDPDLSARDHMGHGTALAMIAAGVSTQAPLAVITGIAPKAWLGNYKVFGTPGFNDGASNDAILKAIDDAVADGMDVINLSLGDDLAPRLADDPEVQAIESASKAGVIVVASAGNAGPNLNTISTPSTAPSAIAVGASSNDRTFAAAVEVDGLSSFMAVLSDGPAPSSPVSAMFADVAAIDGTGLACSSLPANSLRSRIALILRGTCTFETKLNNAQNAGAVAAVIYAAPDSPDPIPMAVGAAALPAEMIGYADGSTIKTSLAGQPSESGTLLFTPSSVAIPGNRLTDFSSAGPGVDLGIKPDMVAVGGNVYTATQTFDVNGDLYDPTGFMLIDGTSFSAPMVAGAAALLKSARPGLTVDQYRSLLINSASDVLTNTGQATGVLQTGGGQLNLDAALTSTVAAYPTSLSFTGGTADADAGRTITITNVGTDTETFVVQATSPQNAQMPAASGSYTLAPGASVDVPAGLAVAGLAPGEYEGFITVRGSASGTLARVPWWYAVTTDTPAAIDILDPLTTVRRGSLQTDGILFRVVDASGLALTDIQPQVTVVQGGGAVLGITPHDTDVPGVYGVDVRLGALPGTNVYRVQVGQVTVDVPIDGR